MLKTSKNYLVDKELTCNGCTYLDFKYKQCRALKEQHCVYDKYGNKLTTYCICKNLNCVTVPSNCDEGDFITVLKDKECVGYKAKNTNKKDNRKVDTTNE